LALWLLVIMLPAADQFEGMWFSSFLSRTGNQDEIADA
jgi:hypothetical protein